MIGTVAPMTDLKELPEIRVWIRKVERSLGRRTFPVRVTKLTSAIIARNRAIGLGNVLTSRKIMVPSNCFCWVTVAKYKNCGLFVLLYF